MKNGLTKYRTWYLYKNSSDAKDVTKSLIPQFPAARNITEYGPNAMFFAPYAFSREIGNMSLSELSKKLVGTVDLMNSLGVHSNVINSVEGLSVYTRDFLQELRKTVTWGMTNCIAFADTSRKWCNPPIKLLDNMKTICKEAQSMLNNCFKESGESTSKKIDYNRYKCEPAITYKDGDILIYLDFSIKDIEKTVLTHAAIYIGDYNSFFSKLGPSFLVAHGSDELARVPSASEICINFNNLKNFNVNYWESSHQQLNGLFVRSVALSVYSVLKVSKFEQDIAKNSISNIISDIREGYVNLRGFKEEGTKIFTYFL